MIFGVFRIGYFIHSVETNYSKWYSYNPIPNNPLPCTSAQRYVIVLKNVFIAYFFVLCVQGTLFMSSNTQEAENFDNFETLHISTRSFYIFGPQLHEKVLQKISYNEYHHNTSSVFLSTFAAQLLNQL